MGLQEESTARLAHATNQSREEGSKYRDQVTSTQDDPQSDGEGQAEVHGVARLDRQRRLQHKDVRRKEVR